MEIYISRAGKVIANYAAGEIAGLVKSKAILPTDFWWKKGMKNWVSFSVEMPPPGIEEAPLQPAVSNEPSWKSPPSHIPSKFGDEPATDKQIALIQSFGITPPKTLTKYDASRWIDDLLQNPEAQAASEELRSQAYFKQVEAGFGCDGFRTPSGKYRKEMAEYAESAEANRQAMQEDLDEAKNMMGVRIDFWEAVLKEGNPEAPNGEEDAIETFLLETGEELADRKLLDMLARKASKIGRVPTRTEIEKAIKEADAVSKTWDDDKPELFFEKLGH